MEFDKLYQIDASEVDSNYCIVDCRENEELSDGVISNSLWLPLTRIADEIEQLIPDKQTPFIIYCARGQRSQLAVRHLNSLGYTQVKSLAGGFAEWRSRGLIVSKSEKATPYARYRSQMALPEIGRLGQEKLSNARVLLVGAGGLGSPIALYLVGAGVGTVGLIDDDRVEEANLHRQILHSMPFIGQPKVISALSTLKALNPAVKLCSFENRLTEANAKDILQQFDIVIDGTDNYESRYLINDACRKYRKINVHGAVFGFQGQVAVFGSGAEDPCYRCLFPEPPPPELRANCTQDGVLGPAVGVIGSQMAIEAIKAIIGYQGVLSKNLMLWDALSNSFDLIPIEKNLNCTCCRQTSEQEN